MKELQLIFSVARQANVPAETHEAVARAAQILAEQLQPTDENTTPKNGKQKGDK